MNSDLFPRRAVYVSPGAVCKSPEYAERLVKEGKVDCFVLRAGFNPLKPDENLDRAVEIVRASGAQCWLLAGTWWGEGVPESDDTMRTVICWEERDSYIPHESRWPMRTPGGKADDDIKASLRFLIKRYSPNAICLTHARFRHPADIRGMFEVGKGKFEQRMLEYSISDIELKQGYEKVLIGLKAMSPKDVIDAAEGKTLPAFLDYVSGSDIFERWVSFRCILVSDSIKGFREVVKSEGKGKILFGQNCYTPIAAVLCGQEYGMVGNFCDFIQPLLGYVRWHVMEPVGVWAKFLHENVKGLGISDAIEVVKGFFGLKGTRLPYNLDDYFEGSEGPIESIIDVVRRAYRLLASFMEQIPAIMPVLRGKDWPKEIIEMLSREAVTEGFAGIAYQGTNYIVDDPPGEGWY